MNLTEQFQSQSKSEISQMTTQARFKIKEVVNFNTIKVEGWTWSSYSGQEVVIRGLEYAEHSDEKKKFLFSKLRALLENESVEIKKAEHVTDTKIKCNVYLNGIDVASYFPKF